MKRTAAFVGATGGAGTTRLCLETAAILSHVGHDVVILDAAFGTQGLSRHVPHRIDTDITALLIDDHGTDEEFSDALIDHPVETTGQLSLCPAYAPFERIARAKTVDAAQALETLVERASDDFDHVIIDTPPVAANQAVAAVNAADTVAVVAPASRRGADAVQGVRGRLADLGTDADTVLANRAESPDEDHLGDVPTIPTSDATAVESIPASAPELDTSFSPAIVAATEVVFDTSLDVEFPEEGLLDIDPDDYLPESLR
ncbi:cell division inhibitor [Haladaptatus sp. R4]|uniref:ParA family protein n=1 Tax=Haladaptatus sp. R4 TaxID=1679489 RepID=UPI0007B48B73|nr:ParA family protein [Haladaptatus sp. R4]KZN25065.1 cell division inhibitor [Haladaptatus sp. R4]